LAERKKPRDKRLPFTTLSELGLDNPNTAADLIKPQLRLVDRSTQPNLASQIDLMLSESDDKPVLVAIRRIFLDLVRLLDCLHLMEPTLHQVRETLALFELIQADTFALLDFTEHVALKSKGLTPALCEVLDGMSFALKHELRRVFEENLSEPQVNESSEVTRAKFTDAHRVLTNCFQQSIITLAQVFDPRLDGRQLFNNSKARLKQSLTLCKDLWTMINLVKRAQRARDDYSFAMVIDRVQGFRNTSMHYLMYRDWGNFERLSAELSRAAKQETERGPLLHQFLCYLETLLGQVKLRGVLAELMPNVFCNESEDQDKDLDWTADELRLAFELYMAG
jgi:hypothetical protein